MLFLCIFLLLVACSISLVAFSIYTGISPMPSSSLAKKKILALTPKNSRKIYELGSGWGGLAILLAKQHPEATVYAYEISFIPWLYSVFLKKLLRIKNIIFLKKNFYAISLNEADVVVCYLFPKAMIRLKEKFCRELAKDCVIISYFFSIPGWEETYKEKIGFFASPIFYYQWEGEANFGKRK